MRRLSNTIIALIAVFLIVLSLASDIFLLDLSMKPTGAPIGDVKIIVMGCGDGVCEGSETCSSCSGDCGSCVGVPASVPAAGGGGGRAQEVSSVKTSDFTIEPELLKLRLQQGETLTRVVTIKNTGDFPLSFSVDLDKFKEYVLLSEDSFSLLPGESKVLTLDFSSPIDMPPDLYMGLISFKTESLTKSLRVILEIPSKKALFDVTLKIPEAYKNVRKGESVLGQITVQNLGNLKPVDVLFYYALKDFDGNLLKDEQETRAIDTSLSFDKNLSIPPNTLDGIYVFYVKVLYENATAISSDTFNVISEEKPKSWITNEIYYLWTIVVILILINLWFLWKRRRKDSIKRLRKRASTYIKNEKTPKQVKKIFLNEGFSREVVDKVFRNFKE